MDRYHGKFFLRLLEFYVLSSIGQLHEQHAEALRKMEPQLVKIYGMNGTWYQIVAAQMDFPDSLPGKIRGLWEGYLAAARAAGAAVDPEEFAIRFVDSNFPDIVAQS
jgi:hypothetical protein